RCVQRATTPWCRPASPCRPATKWRFSRRSPAASGAAMSVSVQISDFDAGAEIAALRRDPSVGAIVTFVGTVRDINEGDSVSSLTLEHYPGMTEKALADIVGQARARWSLNAVRVIHRVGTLRALDQIVFVGVA